MDGFTMKIQEDGSNGIVDIIMEEDVQMMKDKSIDGDLLKQE